MCAVSLVLVAAGGFRHANVRAVALASSWRGGLWSGERKGDGNRGISSRGPGIRTDCESPRDVLMCAIAREVADAALQSCMIRVSRMQDGRVRK